MIQVICKQFGSPSSVLDVQEIERTSLESDSLCVRMSARTINPSDLLTIRGTYSSRISLPFVPGYEGVGTVVDVGESVDRLWIGKRVLAIGGQGTWQDFVSVPANKAIAVPHDLEDSEACQLYINPATAWLMLFEHIKVRTGDYVLANAANSAFGKILCQLAKKFNFHLIAVVRRAGLENELKELGAFAVINSKLENVAARAKTLTGGTGVDAALDAIGGEASQALCQTLKIGGKLVSYGLLSGKPQQIDFELAQTERKQISAFWLRDWAYRSRREEREELFGKIISMVRKRELRLPHASEYPLKDVRRAAVAAESEVKTGKVLII